MEALSGVMKVVQPIMQVAGVVSNLVGGQRQFQVQQQAVNQQKQLAELTKNPAAYAAKIKALQQDLNPGLVQGVENEVQGYLGERGLSLSPSISAQVLGQALGPYQLQEQELAQRALLAPYEIGTGTTNAATGANPGSQDTSGFWESFQQTQKAFPNYSPGMVSGHYGGPSSADTVPPPGMTGELPYGYEDSTQFPGVADYQPAG
jgi:hypothetical protein